MGAYTDAVARAMEAWYSAEYTDATILYNGESMRAHIRYGGQSTGSVAETAVIDVRTADVPSPANRDTVIINGETWRVFLDRSQEAIIKGNVQFWKIPIKRDERPNV